MEEETFIQKRITNQDVWQKLEKMEERDKKILKHAEFTNGKIAGALKEISHLKAKSHGIWMEAHPMKFAIFMIIFLCLVISDVRHPIIELLTKFI